MAFQISGSTPGLLWLSGVELRSEHRRPHRAARVTASDQTHTLLAWKHPPLVALGACPEGRYTSGPGLINMTTGHPWAQLTGLAENATATLSGVICCCSQAISASNREFPRLTVRSGSLALRELPAPAQKRSIGFVRMRPALHPFTIGGGQVILVPARRDFSDFLQSVFRDQRCR